MGSTLAALAGLGSEIQGKIWLLAGGDGKGQDFSPLAQTCRAYAAEVLCYGRDGAQIAQAVKDAVATSVQATLNDALRARCYWQNQAMSLYFRLPVPASINTVIMYIAVKYLPIWCRRRYVINGAFLAAQTAVIFTLAGADGFGFDYGEHRLKWGG